MMLIKNGHLVNADGIHKRDILIQNGKIVRISDNIEKKDIKIIDAGKNYVFPGFIDLHAHLRTPGREDEEDLASGARAAAKGGFTKVFCMPNTDPAVDNQGLAKWIAEESRRIGIVDIRPVGAITKFRNGKELTEFEALRKAGCLSLSDDGGAVADSLVFRRALEYAKMTGILIVSHCEDSRLSDNGVIRESVISSKYGLPAIPGISESIIVNRDIELARYVGAKIHLAHISTARSIDIIRRAKKEKVRVTAETCPHYFSLTVEDVERSGFNGNFKVNPPLGDKSDVKAVKKALKEGVIDCIATDHAPHSLAEKESPFEEAPFGFIGLELAFSLVCEYLLKEKVISINEIAQKMSSAPAKIIGLDGYGEMKEGAPADFAIADLNRSWVVDQESIISKSQNTPFLGRKLSGVIEHTICNGRIVYRNPAAED